MAVKGKGVTAAPSKPKPKPKAQDCTPIVAKRRPVDADLDPILELIYEGASLNAACAKLGLHQPSTDTWLKADRDRSDKYMRAKDARTDARQERMERIGLCATLGIPYVDPDTGVPRMIDIAGARLLLDVEKWTEARQAPKAPPAQRVIHSFDHLTDDELVNEINEIAGLLPAPDAFKPH